MPIEILMPALSPTMEEGTLAKWLVKEGDTVSSGDIMAEIETDKATMEFEAVDEGKIGKILIAEGSANVKVNTTIAILLEEDETMEDLKSTGLAQSAPSAPVNATISKETKPTAIPAPLNSSDDSTGRVFATPLARKIAKDKGIDLSQIQGSGPRGRIVKADVEGASVPKSAPSLAETSVPQSSVKSQSPDAEQIKKIYADRNFEEVSLDGMRSTIASRLTEAKQTIPHFYLRRDIQLDALLKFRSQLNKQLEEKGIKLSVNDFIIKASAIALQEVPDCNAVWAGDRILKLEPSDVAVAVAVEGGLFTPVIRDSHLKSLSALSNEMKDLAGRARDRKLAPHEYQGGSFAISNLGMFGIENFDAVINPPHGSILAVGAGVKKPVVSDEGEVGVATVMSVTLSVDHRVIDGALGAQWIASFKNALENPLAMLA